ncbi:MAG: GAF domain-containing protein [Oligoflexia bacterium]|nr:GAF domain-containing protein [Oligoflexia bacterium]
MKRIFVILIYFMIAAMGFHLNSILTSRDQYKTSTAVYDIASYVKAVRLFYEDFGFYPDGLIDLFVKPSDKNVIVEWPKDGYFRPNVNPHPARPVKDPWNNDYIFEMGINNEIIVSSSHNLSSKNISVEKEAVYKAEAEKYAGMAYRAGLFLGFEIVIILVLIILKSEFIQGRKNQQCESDDYYPILKDILRLSYSDDIPPPMLLHNITTEISRIFPVMRCAVLLIKNAHSAISVASQDNPELREFELNLLNYPELVQMVSTGETLVVDQLDLVTETHMLAGVKELLTEKGIKAILVEPIIHIDRIVGALFIRTCGDKKTFNPEEIELVQLIARATKPVLQNHEKYKELF